MFEEKQQQHTKWFLDGDLKLRQQNLRDGRIGIWVSVHKFNVCFTMIMYDFIEWCRELDINLEVDMSWNNHRGKDLVLLRSEIKSFIDIYNLKPNQDDEKFSEDEWYS
ncbi:hypothetical protein EXW45_15585 [Bacillus wiedmannii]|uniref:hypothetical protein n=1 Tax=Bacillus cereus group TaxID=86661 RepID=UPI0011EC5DAC|nr:MULTISPECIES: hypothetical protein [Bacillus cereus group]KAA0783249.1 hypothetical protein DN394_27950 [Bacillus sp. BB081]QWH72684.1 hypothetical protein EXW45_15585 [Bacillus wiedmannii]